LDGFTNLFEHNNNNKLGTSRMKHPLLRRNEIVTT